MTILVTGGAGYIGSHVVRQLSEAGHEVIIYDNLSTGVSSAFLYGEKLIVGDLSDTQTLDDVFAKHRIEAILHFAASIIVPESVRQPLQYYRNNTINTVNLLEAAVAHGVQYFIFSSTAAVYAELTSGFVNEDSPKIPLSPYGKSKLMSECILTDVAKASNLKYMILRYFNVAGADPKMRMGQCTANATHLIKVCCQAALGLRDKVEIFGTDYNTADGTGIRDYIHVEDLAGAHLSALNHLQQGYSSDTLNVGYGVGSSVREVIHAVQNVSGVKFNVIESARRLGDPAMLVAIADRIKRQLNWQPHYANLEQIVNDSWAWEKNQ